MSVPISSAANLQTEFDRIVRDAFNSYEYYRHASIMFGNKQEAQSDLQDDLPWSLAKTEFASKVQGEKILHEGK